jgi:outer membrane beta-barrel protein
MRAVLLLALLATPALAEIAAPVADFAETCVDPEAKKKLIAQKRQRRASEREFVRQNRHELTAFGGYYVSDLYDGTFIVGGMYTFHVTEDVAIEANAAFSRVRSPIGKRLELDRGITLLPREERVILAFTNVVWSPLHGKFNFFTNQIVHFDLYMLAGVGIIDNSTSFGVAGQLGVGARLLFGRAVALRVDLRDNIFRTQILTTRTYQNDIQLTLGLSLFLPVGL